MTIHRRSRLKICGIRFDGEINPPQSPNLKAIEAVWDLVDREWNKRQLTSKEELLGCPSKSLENYSYKVLKEMARELF